MERLSESRFSCSFSLKKKFLELSFAEEELYRSFTTDLPKVQSLVRKTYFKAFDKKLEEKLGNLRVTTKLIHKLLLRSFRDQGTYVFQLSLLEAAHQLNVIFLIFRSPEIFPS